VRETIVARGADGKFTDVTLEVCAKFDLLVTDDSWMHRLKPYDFGIGKDDGKAKKHYTFKATMVVTEHGKQAYIRFSDEGFFRRIDRTGPIQIEIVQGQEEH
jgi:hypothetical protein